MKQWNNLAAQKNQQTNQIMEKMNWLEKSLELVKLVLVQCNLVNNQYQQKSEVLYTFTANKSYAYLLNIEPNNLVLLKTYITAFDKIIVIFSDQKG